MRDAEESVDRVLRGLRDATASVGMESRVLRGIEKRAAARLRPGRSVGWIAGWATAACAAALILAAAMVAGLRRPVAPLQLRGSSASVSAGVPGNPVGGGQALYAVERPSHREHTRTTIRRVVAMHARATRRVEASQPAPPQPVTREERLLLEVAHTADPGAMALLNPETQRRQELEAKAEFESFFGLSDRPKANNRTGDE